MASIDVRLWQRECVLDKLQARLLAFGDNYFDDIEAKQNIWIVQQPQPGEPAPRNSFSLITIDRIKRPAEVFARPCFYLDENERVAIAADDIDLAAGAPAEITIQDFVTVPPQEPAGQVLPPRAKPQMPGRRTRRAAAPPVRKIGDESDKARVHAV
jgi:hypothetical protein